MFILLFSLRFQLVDVVLGMLRRFFVKFASDKVLCIAFATDVVNATAILFYFGSCLFFVDNLYACFHNVVLVFPLLTSTLTWKLLTAKVTNFSFVVSFIKLKWSPLFTNYSIRKSIRLLIFRVENVFLYKLNCDKLFWFYRVSDYLNVSGIIKRRLHTVDDCFVSFNLL